MIRFSFDAVHSDWRAVMFALDDIEYEVEVNDQVYGGRYTRLAELVALYECCIERKPTSTHPR